MTDIRLSTEELQAIDSMTDADLLSWAEAHSEAALRMLNYRWLLAKFGAETSLAPEEFFNFRHAIREAIREARLTAKVLAANPAEDIGN